MSIDSIIAKSVAQAVKELYGIDTPADKITPQATRKEFEGNLTVVVFPWVKAARKSPEAVGQEIGAWLEANEPAVEKYNVVKGFLNITVAPKFWNSVLKHIADTLDYGIKQAGADSPLVMVEYSSPNTNKPLHLGHIRNNLLGFSLAEILKAWQQGCKDKYCQRQRYTHLQINACLAEMGRRFDSGDLREKGRPSDWRFLRSLRQAL